MRNSGQINLIIDGKISKLVVRRNKKLGWLKREALGERDQDLYRVFFMGRELENEWKTLGDYKIYREAYVLMFTKDYKFSIEVYAPSRLMLKLQATKETSVEDLRRMIEGEDIETGNRLLVHRKVVLDDNRALFTYWEWFYVSPVVVEVVEQLGKSGGTLEMFFYERNSVRHFPFSVYSGNSLHDLKRYTHKIDNSIPVDQMTITFGYELLCDDNRELGEYNFYSGASVQVRRDSYYNMTSLPKLK